MNLNSIQLRQHVPCCALNVTGHTSLPVCRQRGHYSRLHGLPSSGLDQLAASTVSRHRRREHRPGCVCQAASSKQTVAITGATGLVGTALVAKLLALGHSVRVLTRDIGRAKGKLRQPCEYHNESEWSKAIQGATAVVNLAGEPISTRWTSSVKQEIKRSRIETTRKVVAGINACKGKSGPSVLVSASAVGFYGTSESQTFKETDASGSDYLAEVCRDWEAEAQKARADRVVLIRTGIVLDKGGGALGKMLPIFSVFAGGPLGTGMQWCSWIHRDDLVNLYVEAITNPAFKGSFNATAPNPVRMGELCSALGRSLGRPSWLPVPAFALSALLGQGAQVVLDGQKVLPSRTLEQGFSFQYTELDPAIRQLLR